MTISKTKLIKKIAENEHLDENVVLRVLMAMEQLTFDWLKQCTPANPVSIKLMNGLMIESKFIPSQKINRGIIKKLNTGDRKRVKARVTRHFNQRINNFSEN